MKESIERGTNKEGNELEQIKLIVSRKEDFTEIESEVFPLLGSFQILFNIG